MSYQSILDEIFQTLSPQTGEGRVASYIPALANANPHHFGIAVETIHGEKCQVGDAQIPFSIQSISKVFDLALSLQLAGDSIWQRVGMEPSGNPFNSLVQLEYENGIPRNPFINAGALVIIDILLDYLKSPDADLEHFVGQILGQETVVADRQVALSELEEGYTNKALLNFMKSFGNVHHEVDDVLKAYYHQCSITMDCVDLARSFLFLANGGVSPATGASILSASQCKRLNAIMLTCGVYDAAGVFAYRVGLPGKSGVGGGIAAVIPNELAIAVWSPPLDEFGNSLIGCKALELFTTMTGRSIF